MAYGGTCYKDYLSASGMVMNCLIDKFTSNEYFLKKMAYKMGIDVATDYRTQMVTQFKAQFGETACYRQENWGQYVKLSQFTTQATCEASTSDKVCTDPRVATEGSCTGKFCGAQCEAGYCRQGFDWNESTCTNMGWCIGTSTWKTKADCESASYCFVPNI
jgi:hypothetical protein